MKIILFNGPPGCGKDTAALIVEKYLHGCQMPARCEKLSMPIKRAFAGTMHTDIDDYGNVIEYEHKKEDILSELGGSYRQWQIDFSEKFMKPRFGAGVFTRLLLDRLSLLHPTTIILVSDCGFQIEYDVLASSLPPHQIALVRLYRPNCTFLGDSREYVKPGSHKVNGIDQYNCTFLPLANNGDIEHFRYLLLASLRPFLEQSDD